MQKLIGIYLLQHKKCALPEIGTLEIGTTGAEVISEEKKINSRLPAISFTDHFTDSADLQNYISVNKEISIEEAGYQLQKFCKELNALQKETYFEIPGAGNFYISNSGKLAFDPVIIPQRYRPEVQAVIVDHTNPSDTVVTGDIQTADPALEEFFKEEKHPIKTKWRIAAVILFLISTAVFFFYMNNINRNSFFGSSDKPEVKPASPAYRKIP